MSLILRASGPRVARFLAGPNTLLRGMTSSLSPIKVYKLKQSVASLATTTHTSTTMVQTISKNAQTKLLKQFDMSGHVVIVTGGSQGLGLAMAEAAAEAGSTGINNYIKTSCDES